MKGFARFESLEVGVVSSIHIFLFLVFFPFLF